jgi:hypothetical protein
MSIPTYSPAQATTLVAVGCLQSLASWAGNLFLDERYTRAADNLLRSFDSASTGPAGFSGADIALAVEPPAEGEMQAVTKLRLQGRELADKAITNVKRTLRRQFALRSSQVPEGECNSAAEVENRLECHDLLVLATPRQREVLALRLIGNDDELIAVALGITAGNVAVLAYRGVSRIRDSLAARGSFEELAA